MDLQHQIAIVEQKQQQLLTQAEQARLVRQLGAERTSLFAQGYAAALRAIRGSKQDLELQEPTPIRPTLQSDPPLSGERDGPIAA
jgi:hypothetical protein